MRAWPLLRAALCVLPLAACADPPLPAGAPAPPPPPAAATPAPVYEFRAVHDPNGIGKFYMGREIAHVMGHPAATWLERPQREKEEAPTKVIAALDLRPDDVVADIGAGSGYYAFRIAPAVNKVLAVDIQPEMLEIIRKKAAETKTANIEVVRGVETDPRLPGESTDLALLVDVYHEFAYPVEMMAAIRKALKPEGRVALVEFRAEDASVPIKAVHKMSEAQAKKEMEAAGFRWVKTVGTAPWQHVMIFGKATEQDSSSK
jgi:ubiquinone/menaquinone biosynthesis C-methylase UbiE